MSKNDTHEPKNDTQEAQNDTQKLQNDTQKLNKKKTSKRSHVSSNRSVIPELAEGSPADNKIPLPPPRPQRVGCSKYNSKKRASR